MNIPTDKIPLKRFFGYLTTNFRLLIKNSLSVLFRRKFAYPLVAGYSDTFLVTATAMPKFVQYCGAFAAQRLFVEIAIPTAMVLATDKLKIWDNKEVFYNIKNKGIEKFNNSLNDLLSNFPNTLYLHPIKLSKWK